MSPLTAAALLLGYLVWQPWPRPTFFGNNASVSNAHVGTNYVCGDAISPGGGGGGDTGQWPVEVTTMSLSTRDDVEAVLFAASRSSPYYIIGSAAYDEWPPLDQRAQATAGFDLGPDEQVRMPHRVKVAIKPRSLGNVGRFTATVTYKYRWLPPRSVKVDFACQLDVTRTGPDPRAE